MSARTIGPPTSCRGRGSPRAARYRRRGSLPARASVADVCRRRPPRLRRAPGRRVVDTSSSWRWGIAGCVTVASRSQSFDQGEHAVEVVRPQQCRRRAFGSSMKLWSSSPSTGRAALGSSTRSIWCAGAKLVVDDVDQVAHGVARASRRRGGRAQARRGAVRRGDRIEPDDSHAHRRCCQRWSVSRRRPPRETTRRARSAHRGRRPMRCWGPSPTPPWTRPPRR